ncbi:MAG TPA: VOC family protein [Cellulomonas sp.]
MDAPTLRVGDLEAMSSYYAQAFAFEPLEERGLGGHVHRVLGRGSTPMLRLVHTPDLPVARPGQAGLFHNAFLLDDAASLAATVFRAAQHPLSRFIGSADHLVSEAFYFTDPEGNGIELYTDRPRDQWVWDRGAIRMDTLRLDPGAYLRSHLSPEAPGASEALGASGASGEQPVLAGRVGHVHLQVGDVAAARAFYVDAIGFEATLTGYPGALFASAGGYHHHIAMNVWNSAGAGPRAASLGLGEVAVTVPAREDLDALVARLSAAGLAFADDGRSVTARDPWHTQVTVGLPGATATDLLAL